MIGYIFWMVVGAFFFLAQAVIVSADSSAFVQGAPTLYGNLLRTFIFFGYSYPVAWATILWCVPSLFGLLCCVTAERTGRPGNNSSRRH
jgi:hypothetical protein